MIQYACDPTGFAGADSTFAFSQISHFQAVFKVDKEKGLTLIEVRADLTVENIIEATGCQFEVCNLLSTEILSCDVELQVSPDLKPMGQAALNQ